MVFQIRLRPAVLLLAIVLAVPPLVTAVPEQTTQFNLVLVDGMTNPGQTLGKFVGGTLVNVFITVPTSQEYGLYNPLGVLTGTNTPLDGVNVTFANVTLVPGWWSLKKPDGTEQTSFEVISIGELKDIGSSQVRINHPQEMANLLSAYGDAFYFQLDYLHCVSGYNSDCDRTSQGQNGNIALTSGQAAYIRVQYNISLSAVSDPNDPYDPVGYYHVKSYLTGGFPPGPGDWAVPSFAGRPFAGGMGQPDQGRYEYSIGLMLIRLSPGRALTSVGDAHIYEQPCTPPSQCGDSDFANTSPSIVQVSNS